MAEVRLLGQQPALDGLRAVAVVAVMGFHADPGRFHGGYFGVDIFFVLSGFLITSLLLAEREAHARIDFPAFYARRGLRLLPALVTMVAAVVALSVAAPDISSAALTSRDAPATIFYVANWVYATESVFEFGYLSHMWSLSIEEQFYFFWPLALTALLAVGARRSKPLLVGALVGGFVVSNALRWSLFEAGVSLPRLVFGTDTRLGGLLLGGALGLLFTWDLLPRTRLGLACIRVSGAVAAVTLAWLLLGERYAQSALNLHPERVIREGYAVIAVASVVFLLWLVVEPASPLARALSLRPMVWIGKTSYGLYLWHVPVDRFLDPERLGWPTFPTQILRVVVTLAIVSASYYLLEQPCLRLKRRFERRPDRVAADTLEVAVPGATPLLVVPEPSAPDR